MSDLFYQRATELEQKGQRLIDQIKVDVNKAVEDLKRANKELEECPKEDASENAQLQTARENQARANHALFMLQKRLDAFEHSITNYTPIGVITLGTTVHIVLKSIDGTTPDQSSIEALNPANSSTLDAALGSRAERTLRMVHHDASDVAAGFMAIDSRLGQAIMGHVEGDEVVIAAPRGTLCYKIERVY